MLNETQAETVEKIREYGEGNGLPSSDIQIAINVAFLESSLGINLNHNIPGNTSSGLYQYNNGTWSDRHSSLGNKDSFDNQIKAFYNDLNAYHLRYENLSPSDKSFQTVAEYAYTKHHEGWNFSDFRNPEKNKGKKLYDDLLSDPSRIGLIQIVTLCIKEGTYIYDGSAKRATGNSRIIDWIEKIEKEKKITQHSLSGVLRSDAETVIRVDPTGSFYIQEDQ